MYLEVDALTPYKSTELLYKTDSSNLGQPCTGERGLQCKIKFQAKKKKLNTSEAPNIEGKLRQLNRPGAKF